MRGFRKVLGLAALAGVAGLGGCAQLMPQLGFQGPGSCAQAAGYTPAAPWHQNRSSSVFGVRSQFATMQSRYSLGSNASAVHAYQSRTLGAGDCR
jgi:hypothetical protein